jgi:hypothetical protein
MAHCGQCQAAAKSRPRDTGRVAANGPARSTGDLGQRRSRVRVFGSVSGVSGSAHSAPLQAVGPAELGLRSSQAGPRLTPLPIEMTAML